MDEKKDRFSLSEDELNHIMEQKKKLHDEPVQKAVALIEAAADKVLSTLGVDCSDPETIAFQMDNLGIIMTEHTDERAPQLNGFFIFKQVKSDIIPYAWVGATRVNSSGECFCDIQWFIDERLEETGGIKIVGQ